MSETILSPIQPPANPKHFYPYEPNQNVLRPGKHILGREMFIIRRITSTVDKEAYEARYIDNNGVLVLDIFFPEEFTML